MKNFLFILLLFFSANLLVAQQTTVNYTVNNAEILNPERGFYRYTDTYGSSPYPLSVTYLNQLRQTENRTILFRYVYLDTFFSGPISTSFLNSIQNDFDAMRQAGFKVVLRFAYSSTYNPNPPHEDGPDKATIMQHIEQLKPYLKQNLDVILTLQNGFYGIWGENFYSDAFGCECNGPLTAQNWADRKEVSDSLLAILQGERILSVRYPRLKTEMYASQTSGGYSIPSDSLTYSEAYSGSVKSLIGYHNDCFLVAANDYTFDNTNTEKPFWETESKYTIMGGETCGDTPTFTNCTNALTDLENAHWTYLNDYYHPDVLDRWGTEGCYNEISKRLGYRINLIDGTYDNEANQGGLYNYNIQLTNTGFASIVNERPLYMVFDNGSQTYTLPIDSDVRRWYADGNYTINEAIDLPSNMQTGLYNIYLYLPDAASTLSSDPRYAIQLANTQMWDASNGWNDLQMQVNIVSTTTCTTGASCNDNNVCTTGDVYDANCNCAGTFADADNDGVCDANDQCPGTNDGVIGTICNDGDPCTINDTFDTNCNCSGTFQDSDGDGICDANDQCSGVDDSVIGTICNDGDPCTINDTFDTNCNCVGTFQDSDGDGICDANDTPNTGCTNVTNAFPNNPLTHAGAGSNSTTLNLSGTHQDVSFTISNITQKLNGSNNKKYIEQVTVSYIDGNGVTQIYGVYSGANTSTANVDISGEVQSVTVSLTDIYDGNSGSSSLYVSFTDVASCKGTSTGGGGCTTIGQTCDDADVCTINDVYDSNCNCVGTFQDSDGDGICDANDTVDPPGSCTNTGFNFTNNPLTKSGSGSNSTTLSFPANSTDVSFSIANINQKTSGKTSRKYIEQVTVTYIDGTGTNQIYGVYSGANTNSVNVNISGEVQSVTVSLQDIFDGSTQSLMSVDFTNVTACVVNGNRLENLVQYVSDITVIPNPIQNFANLYFNSKYNLEAAIQLNAIDGSIVKQQRVLTIKGENRVQLDMSQLPKGIYFISIEIKGEKIITKIIK